MMAKRPEEIIREEVAALAGYRVPDASGMVKLDAMENPYPLPAALSAEIARVVEEVSYNRYPDPAAKRLKARLREAMAVPDDMAVVVGNGSDELIQTTMLATGRPGAVVLGVEPSFVMFPLIAAFCGVRFVGVPLAPNFELDTDRVLEQIAIHRPALVIIAYAGDSGLTLVKEALENGLFKRFIGTDGLRDNMLIEKIGADNLKDSFFTSPSSPKSEAADKFNQLYTAKYQTTKDKIFIGQVYDSVMLAALAIQQAGSTDRAKVRDALRQVANPPGEAVGPGDWAKAVELIKAGKDIDYTGATGSMDFDDKGDVAGVIGHFVVDDSGTGYKEVGLVTP